MQIIDISTGEYADISVSGTELTITELTVDLAEKQTDHQTIIDISGTNGQIDIGPGQRLIASIAIPPAEYGDDGDKMPIDMSSVTVTRWPYHPKPNQEQ
jgi:hypothetical protein